MADNIRMDSHKLIFHPQRVSDWLSGKPVYPIEIEIGLSGACNHRCIFCAVDYMGYKPNFLDAQMLTKNLEILARNGLKSVIYSGEGEPLLNKNAPDIFNKTKALGIDVAMASNGVMLTKDVSEHCLQSFTWIRFSIAAVNAELYHKIQRGGKNDLDRVLQNLQDAVNIKHDRQLKVTLGAQCLLLPDNKSDVPELARTLRTIGLDYLTVKPFSQHPSSLVKREVDYSETAELAEELKQFETEDFKIYFRHQSIVNVSATEKEYDCCYALPFMTHIDAKGDVFPCVAFVGNKELCYGNLYEHSFDEIWESERTKKIMSIFQGEFLKKNCRKACRLDEMNKYLSALKHPSGHVNFI